MAPASGIERRLLDRGVVIPRPDLVSLADDVDPDRFEAGVEILPGSRVEGAATLAGRGSRIGSGGPAAVRNCALGRGVDLASGVFEDSVFLDGAAVGPAAHVRGGTLFEEHARAAHAVGTKQTILLPFVTLGSLINFCDCLMAGGTGESDHGEVGSGFIHFNFTPGGDKATPSLFGNVTEGVFLRSPRIFLGGHAGVVGPLRVGFGAILAAGAVYRRDCPEGTLSIAAPPKADVRRIEPGVVRGAPAKVGRNVAYIGELAALLAFYRSVRSALCGPDAHRRLLVGAAIGLIQEAIAERLKQLAKFATLLQISAERLRARDGGGDEAAWQADLGGRLARARAAFAHAGEGTADPGRDVLVREVPPSGADYLAWVRGLSQDARLAGVAWLSRIRNAAVGAFSAEIPLILPGS